MALRGETIGTAYVRILADGRGLDESIRKEMHDSEPAIEVAGREHEKAYSKAYNDQLAKDKNFERSYRRNLDKAFGSMAGRSKLLAGNVQQNIADAISEGFNFQMDVPVGINPDPDLERRAKLIGDRAAANIAEGLNEGLDPKNIDFGREIRRAIHQVDTQIQDDMVADWRRGFNEINDITRTTTNNINRDFRGAGFALREARSAIRELENEFRIAGRATKELDKVKDGFGRARREISQFGDSVGRSLGKGSRNDFVNIVGSIIGGLVKLPGTMIGLFEGIKDVGAKILEPIGRITAAFQEGITQGEKWAGAISQSIAEVVALGPAAIGVAAAVLLIGGAIGGVVSAVASLAGALVGLVATVGFGLVGILGGAAAALIPLAAAIGGVALAIHGIGGFDDLKKQIKPLKATFDDLSKVVAKGAFANMGANVEKANTALEKMRPLARAVGIGLGRMFDGFIQGLDSPEWKQFRDALTQFLPGAMASLGRIISNIFGGVGGVFRALITNIGGSKSIATEFLNTVETITGRFDRWVNSVKGQTAVHEFFNKAWASAQKLGGFISAAIGLIGDLLNAARPTGDSLFGDMTEQLKTWSIWLEDPAHQDEINKWFGDALGTARRVGAAIETVGNLIAAIDTPTNRRIGQLIFGAIAANVQLVTVAVEGLGFLIDGLVGQFRLFLGVVRPVFNLIAHIPGNPFQLLAAGAVRAIDAADKAAGSFQKFRTQVQRTSNTKVDINTAPALQKMGYMIKTTKTGQQVVEHLDGTKVDLKTAQAVLALQRVHDKAVASRNKVDALDGNKVQINTQQAQNALGFVGTSAKGAKGEVDQLDGTDVNVSTGSAVSNINAIASAAVNAANQVARIALGGSGGGKAAGGVIWGPQRLLVGEEGPEAIVPLNRPLGRVDPAVRQLSAIAQGMNRMASGGVVGTPGKVVNVGGMQIITPTKDPVAVASEVVNHLVGVGY